MKAVVHQGGRGFEHLFFTEMEEREPGAGEVKVKLRTAGLNHRDIWNLFRRKEGAESCVLGSDGAGIVEAVGSGVVNVRVGDEVVINPMLRWYEGSDAPPSDYEILGVPTHGTFAEKIMIPAVNVTPKPEYMSWEEAGVFSLAALTAYRALFTRGKVKEGDVVLIPGIGSGVAILALLMAKAVGARAVITSRSEAKRKKALELGADAAIDTGGDWNEALPGGKADIVIESVGAATWNKSVNALRPGGTIVCFGATAGRNVEMNLSDLYFGQFNLLGTTMGSHAEYREMLPFMEKHRIKPVIDSFFPLADADKAFKRMDDGENFGKIGFRIS